MSRMYEYLRNLEDRYEDGFEELRAKLESEEEQWFLSNETKYEVRIQDKTLVGTEEQLVEYLKSILNKKQ